MPFEKGKKNPTKDYYLSKNQKVQGKGFHYPLPVKEFIIKKAKEEGIRETTQAFGVHPRTYFKWQEKLAKFQTLEDQHSGGAKKKYSPEEREEIQSHIKHDPQASYSIYARDLNLPKSTVKMIAYEAKIVQKEANWSHLDTNLERLIDMQAGWMEGMEDADIKLFAWYDQFPLYLLPYNKPGKVQSKSSLYTRKPYRCTKLTGHVLMTWEDVMKVDIRKENANTEEVHRFLLTNIRRKKHASNLGGRNIGAILAERNIKFVVMDHLGKSERAKNPTAQHFSPEIDTLLESKGIKKMLLPPKGHELNPVELLNRIIQDKFFHWLPPDELKDDYGNKQRGLRTFEEAQTALLDIIEDFRNHEGTLKLNGFIRERAFGRGLKRCWKESEVAQQVLKKREEGCGGRKKVLFVPLLEESEANLQK